MMNRKMSMLATAALTVMAYAGLRGTPRTQEPALPVLRRGESDAEALARAQAKRDRKNEKRKAQCPGFNNPTGKV